MATGSRYLFALMLILMMLSGASAQTTSLRETRCRFNLPQNVTIDCYTLRVPENRQVNDSKDIRLAIAILRHPSGNPEPDPIVFLQGGPGGSTLNNLENTFAGRFQPLLATNRDIVLFDQRGTGNSSPRLDCTVYQGLQLTLLDFELDGQYLSRSEVENRLNKSLIDCGEGLSVLHDLDGYNSRENAADVDAIRSALGYEQINLWGISYGTKLALTTMRDYPDSIRRVVLDSAYPLEANLYTELPASFNRALKTLFEACAADAACDEIYPDLEIRLFETVNRLNRRAIRFDAPDPYTNVVFEDVIFDGSMMLRSLFQLLYATDVLPSLPQLIYEAYYGNFDRWLVLVGWLTAQRDTIATGMNYATQCQEEFVFTDSGSIEAAWRMYPQFTEYSQYIDFTAELTPICAVFSRHSSTPQANLAVQSNIPTLITAGQYDPITPPQWGEQVAASLENSMFIEFAHHGHGPTGSNGCAQSIIIEYLQTPDVSTVDTSCMNDLVMIFSGTLRGDFNLPNSARAGGTMSR